MEVKVKLFLLKVALALAWGLEAIAGICHNH
jgi:hypothetical protein